MSDITLRVPTGETFELPLDYFQGSEFIKALVFEDGAKQEVDITLPLEYAEFAVKYLRATGEEGFIFENDIEAGSELHDLSSPENVAKYPQLMEYIFGYLDIETFGDFYQRMLLEAIRSGMTTRAIAGAVDERVLGLLTEQQLYDISEFNPKVVDQMIGLPNSRRYLQVRVAQYHVALYETIPLEIRSRGRLFIQGRPFPTDNPVTKVYASVADKHKGYYYYIDELGRLFEGSIVDQMPNGARQIEIPDTVVVDCSTNGRTTLILTEEGKVYGYGDNSHRQLGPGPDMIAVPQLLELDFACIQAVVGVDRSLLLSNRGQVYRLNEVGLETNESFVDIRHVAEFSAEQGILMVTKDLDVIRQNGTVLARNIYVIATESLFLTSELTAVDLAKKVVQRRVIAVVASPLAELYLSVTGTTRLFKYQGEEEDWRREKVLKARR
jgi:hypothetical protein